jgi:hypothetical protein
MTSVLDIALGYVRRGWNPVPVSYRSKAPIGDSWQARVIDASNVASFFDNGPQNVGVILGPRSHGLTDVDLDCAEAIAIAPFILPPTKAIFGRASKRASHWLYTTDLAVTLEKAALRLCDPNGGTLLELRVGGDGKGAQTVFPGSIHESGEQIVWEQDGEPASIAGDDLIKRVQHIGAACLIAREWPVQGKRHAAALTVGGFLARAGLTETKTTLMIEAITRAANDEEWRDRVRAVKDAGKHLAATDQGAGLPKFAALVGDKAARLIARWLDYAERKWTHQGYTSQSSSAAQSSSQALALPRPQRSPRPSPPWPELASDALYGLTGDVVAALAPHTESDPVALLIQYLASVGNAIGRGPHYRVEADKHFTNLFAVLVGQSSKSRKGTSAGRIRAVMRVADQEWATRCIQGGMSSGEGVIWCIRDPIYKMKKGQRELEDPGISDKRLLLDEREFFQALSVMKREGSILSRVIRDAWDGRDYIASLTKHSPACATEPHISIVAHITEEELRRTLDHTSMANGYANRFNFGCVRRARFLPHGGQLDDAVVHQLGVATGRAIHKAKQVTRVTMTAAAAQSWETVYPQLSEGFPGLLGAITGRAEAQTIRLALLYALLDGADQIGRPHLDAALAVWEYCEASAKYIFGDLIGDPLTDEILRALRAAGTAGMTRTDIHGLFDRNQSSAAIGAALGTLFAAGKIQRDEQRSQGRGRPAEVWAAI